MDRLTPSTALTYLVSLFVKLNNDFLSGNQDFTSWISRNDSEMLTLSNLYSSQPMLDEPPPSAQFLLQCTQHPFAPLHL